MSTGTDEGIVSLTMQDEAPMGKLAELYTRHVPDAVRFAFLLSGDRSAAEDLAQEAFIRVAGRFRHLRDPEAFHAYLRRTIVNLHTSSLRRRQVERAYLRREAGRSNDRVADGPDVGEREEMRAALAKLPARQRAAIVLRYYEDLSERQTAEALGCSEAAARSLVARGMEVLRGEITRDETTGEDR